jgi:hypothetical protein
VTHASKENGILRKTAIAIFLGLSGGILFAQSKNPSFLSSGAVQGIIIGAVLAFLTANLIMNVVVKAMTTTVNGWSTTVKCGRPGNGIFLRAACAKVLPAVNVAEEAAYWTTTVDGKGQTLNGRHNYVLHFPAGQLPPNEAFWSLTMNDVAGFMVNNPIDRYSVGGRSGLVPNPDGSVDIYIQSTAPAEHESNWLPAPGGKFKLMLRAYMPGHAILDGQYHVPPVVKGQ